MDRISDEFKNAVVCNFVYSSKGSCQKVMSCIMISKERREGLQVPCSYFGNFRLCGSNSTLAILYFNVMSAKLNT